MTSDKLPDSFLNCLVFPCETQGEFDITSSHLGPYSVPPPPLNRKIVSLFIRKVDYIKHFKTKIQTFTFLNKHFTLHCNKFLVVIILIIVKGHVLYNYDIFFLFLIF